ncbi:MAG: imidazole glycerol phosphate synthase subunit HisH [Arenicella sp.]|nr:imidazole glycerol phosphate synthase subunit HisH [Arenicella sp.]
MQIAVIDLGVGNLTSVKQALTAVAPDCDVVVTSDERVIDSADRVVMPGQGAVGTWFAALHDRKLESVVRSSLANKPMLGICIGMQALFDHCQEDGGIDGLGLFSGSVRHFSHFHSAKDSATKKSNQERLKIPQMGWNQVVHSQDHALWHGIKDQSHFYFVHSFCANISVDADSSMVYGEANYGHDFIAAVGRDNVFAVQFHPEKSHDDGLKLLKNFTQWSG